MKKKLLVSVLATAALLTAAIVLYKPLGCRALERAAWDYIRSQGYTDDAVESVRIDHSYISGLLGGGQWITEVIFKDEPNISYDCVVRGTLRLRVTGLYAASIHGDVAEGYVYMHETVS